MEHKAISIRPFIGAKNFEQSRNFYRDLGFKESILFKNMSYFRTDSVGFYLQDAYVQDWETQINISKSRFRPLASPGTP